MGVSGAVFEGASDGAASCRTKFMKSQKPSETSEISQIFSDIFWGFFTPTFFY